MNIFISHAVANKKIARSLADTLEAARDDVTTFLASRPGDIRADENWLGGIERALQEADTYIVLLTPESVLRPWVNFESGAAWFFKRQLVFVRIQALSTDDIPLPINSRQVYALDNKEQLLAVFSTLGLPLAEPELVVAKFAEQAAAAAVTGEDEAAWEGIQVGDVFYAWAGSLLALEDRDSVPPPSGLLEEIERRGFKPRWANMDKMGHHIERGLAQVFATDRKTWRRPVMDRKRPLMVGKNKP
jgi:TIR domain